MGFTLYLHPYKSVAVWEILHQRFRWRPALAGQNPPKIVFAERVIDLLGWGAGTEF